ncbi:MAG: IPExxxVDY family protein, partial [Prevotellaceae bacterium]|nr:IPExxxVDY family protein [Prevotellaceae bacterium]
MAKFTNKKVVLDNKEKFSVLAICASEPDTRMAWLLNRALYVDFVNKRDLLGAEVDGQRRLFAVFEAEDEARELRYTLITIRQESEMLVKSYANVDFLLA